MAESRAAWAAYCLQLRLVDSPDDLVIKFEHSTRSMLISSGSHPQYRGKLIGRQGRTAHSLRVVVNAICSRLNFKSVIEIVED